jgi:hypothetical protein
MDAARHDQSGLAANVGVEVLSNEKNVDNRRRTTLLKDQIRLCVSYPVSFAAVLNLLNIRVKRLKTTRGPLPGNL